MPELNKANRQVCDVDIRIKSTMAPFLFFDTANTTTAGLTGDAVYAMAKGTRRIAFQNPLEGTMTVEAQVYPFKLFSLFSDGVIETTAAVARHEVVKATSAGALTLPANIVAGTAFVYPNGQYGEESAMIAGTLASTTFTATESTKIVEGESYEVGYVVTKETGVKKVSFSNKKLPKDYFITMSTLDKDDQGVYTPFLMTAYKASIQRNFELSFNSEGDPATVTLTFFKRLASVY